MTSQNGMIVRILCVFIMAVALGGISDIAEGGKKKTRQREAQKSKHVEKGKAPRSVSANQRAKKSREARREKPTQRDVRTNRSRPPKQEAKRNDHRRDRPRHNRHNADRKDRKLNVRTHVRVENHIHRGNHARPSCGHSQCHGHATCVVRPVCRKPVHVHRRIVHPCGSTYRYHSCSPCSRCTNCYTICKCSSRPRYTNAHFRHQLSLSVHGRDSSLGIRFKLGNSRSYPRRHCTPARRYYRPIFPIVYQSYNYVSPVDSYGGSSSSIRVEPVGESSAELGWKALGNRNFADSLQLFKSALALDSQDSVSRIGCALSLSALDHHDDAVLELREAIRMDQDSLQYTPMNHDLAEVLSEVSNTYELRAAEWNDADSWFMIAAVQFMLGDPASAYFAVDQAFDAGDHDESTTLLKSQIEQALIEQLKEDSRSGVN